jgi:RNA polymerase sigma-70 factor, ECF subfamily
MRRSQQGDRRAFRALLMRYDWRLRGLAHALLLDPGRVDAVLRVAYVKAWREVVRIDPREDPSAWLYRVVYNGCIDGLRRESSRIGAAPPAAADVPDAADAPAQPTMPASSGNGASPTPNHGRQAGMVEALAGLAPADRVAVVLVDREGFAPEAAARILGLTPDVVEARLAGARARLMRRLADDAPTAPAEDAESHPDAAESPSDGAESPSDGAESPSDEAESPSDEAESPSDEAEAEIQLDDPTSADPVDTKVASRSTASGSPNGASGRGSANGSDHSGGGGP